MTESKTGMSFSRRNFIKGAAMLTATGTLAGCSPQTENLSETGADSQQDQAPKEEIRYGVCRSNCFGGCMLKIHVRDGRVVRTSAGDFPNPEYNRICSKGLTQVLGVTSFGFVKKHMRTESWKRLQRWAYVFFGLVYVHLMLMLAPAASRGGEAALVTVAVYTVVFGAYAVLRVRRAFVDRRVVAAVGVSATAPVDDLETGDCAA